QHHFHGDYGLPAGSCRFHPGRGRCSPGAPSDRLVGGPARHLSQRGHVLLFAVRGHRNQQPLGANAGQTSPRRCRVIGCRGRRHCLFPLPEHAVDRYRGGVVRDHTSDVPITKPGSGTNWEAYWWLRGDPYS
ncbi:hypothetical protein LCGC14_2724850, partial [marine sediment metagenome]